MSQKPESPETLLQRRALADLLSQINTILKDASAEGSHVIFRMGSDDARQTTSYPEARAAVLAAVDEIQRRLAVPSRTVERLVSEDMSEAPASSRTIDYAFPLSTSREESLEVHVTKPRVTPSDVKPQIRVCTYCGDMPLSLGGECPELRRSPEIHPTMREDD